MASDNEFRIEITADGTVAEAVFGKVGKQAAEFQGRMEKSSAGTRLAFWGVGEAAENAAQSMGVPFQMARQLGNATESLAARLGQGAVAFGAIGLAVMAGVSIWRHYANAQKEAREQSLKNLNTSSAWIESAYREKAATEEITRAKELLLRAEQQLHTFQINQGLVAQRELVVELGKVRAKAYEQLTETGFDPVANLIFGDEKTRQTKFQKADADFRVALAKLNYYSAQARLVATTNAELSAGGGPSGGNLMDRVLSDLREYTIQAGIEAQEMADEVLRIEMNKYVGIAEVNRMIAADKEREYQNEQRLNQMRLQAAQGTLGNLEQMFALLYQRGGNSARKWFSMYKIAAIGNTIMDTAAGAMRAIAQFGVLGIPFAAAITALGALKIQLINRQKFDGGGGDTGGGGAGGGVGTYPVSSTTGLPYSPGAGGGQSINLTLNINGQPYNIGDITSGVVKTLYDNNGSMGGITVSLERSA